MHALGEGLKCPIVVILAGGRPLTMDAEYVSSTEKGCGDGNGWDKKKTLSLFFHQHYYGLGSITILLFPRSDTTYPRVLGLGIFLYAEHLIFQLY